MAAGHYLSWSDYVVFGVLLAVSGSIGVYFAIRARRNASAEEYLLASKQLTVAPVSLSLLASFVSAISLLGIPADIYVHGTQYVWVVLAYIMVMLICNEAILPVYVKLKVNTSYQYLQLRFNKAVQIAGCLSFCLQMVLYMGIVIYAPSLALSQVTGFNLWAGVVSIGVCATFYTSIGGIKAVVWTDVIQIFLMLIGALVTLTFATIRAGGVASVWRKAADGGRLEFFNISLDPTVRHTIWTQLIGQTFVWVAVYGTNQTMVQRALTLGKIRKMKIAYWINSFGLFMAVLLCSSCGLVAYATYAGCDPRKLGRISAYDQLMPLMVMDSVSHIPLMPGLFVAAIFSGALSTVSSGVNSLASVTIHDLLAPVVVNYTEQQKTVLCKVLAAGFGLLSLGFAVIASFLGSVLQAALGVFGMVGGPLLGVYTLGMFFKIANSKGALAGHVISQAVIFWIGFGYYVNGVKSPSKELTLAGCSVNSTAGVASAANATAAAAAADELYTLPVYKVSYSWYAMYGWILAIVVGLIVSALTRDKKQESRISKDHFSPVIHRFLTDSPSGLQGKVDEDGDSQRDKEAGLQLAADAKFEISFDLDNKRQQLEGRSSAPAACDAAAKLLK